MAVQLKFIVTGMPRSGTTFMAHALTTMGISCGHEAVFTPYGVQAALRKLQNPQLIVNSRISRKAISYGWAKRDMTKIVADSSYLAAPFLDRAEFADAKIIHVLRNPIQIFNSLLRAFNNFKNKKPRDIWERFIYQHVPSITQHETPLARAVEMYLHWNRLIERKAEGHEILRFKIESLKDEKVNTELVKSLADFLEIDEERARIVFLLPKNINHRKRFGQPRKLQNLPDPKQLQELLTMAESYGYSIAPSGPAPRR